MPQCSHLQLIAAFSSSFNTPLKSDPVIRARSIAGCCSRQNEARVLAILHEGLGIRSNGMEIKMSKMAPAIQHDPAPEWLPPGSDNKTIVLAPVAWIRFSPVELESFEFQSIKRNEQVFRPLVAVAPFLQTMIDEEIVENRCAEHAVLPP